MPPRVALTSAAAILALATVGCETFVGTTCDTSLATNPPVFFTQGTTTGDVYATSPWDGPLLLFAAGAYYDLHHDLQETPQWVDIYVSFSETGAAGGGLARASGSEALLTGAGPDTITVHNDACDTFWLLVVAGTGAAQPTPP